MKLRGKIITITLFAIAMGFLESAVVVYLRDILYPAGFEFPLLPIPVNLAITELFRELATMFMLVTIGILAARRFSTGFAWFIYSFAIWDIFYYIFLKSLLSWPESLFTWDVLFLIPTTWTGPVLSPVLVSLTMILFAILILFQAEKGRFTRIIWHEWAGFILGSLVLIFAFVFDYSRYMLTHLSPGEMFKMKDPGVLEITSHYIPHRFPWWIFGLGELIILGTIGSYWKRITQSANFSQKIGNL